MTLDERLLALVAEKATSSTGFMEVAKEAAHIGAMVEREAAVAYALTLGSDLTTSQLAEAFAEGAHR